MKKILLVAERMNVPRWKADRVERWTRLWRRAPERCFFTTPAMAQGPTRQALDQHLGGLASGVDDGWSSKGSLLVRNLLPPSKVCGDWDREWARDVADHVASAVRIDERYVGVVLLGTRVAEAFGLGHVPMFEQCKIYGEPREVPCLRFCHPSGRSRALNDEGERSRQGRRLRRFISSLL